MADLVVEEAGVPVVKWTLTKLWHGLGYMCCYKSNIGDLDKQIQQLCDKRDGVDLDVKRERDASKTINPEVVTWLSDVDKKKKKVDTTFSKETVAAKAACCNGWLPNLKGRFSLGWNAKKITLEVDQLLAKVFRTIAHSPSHPEVEFRPTDYSTQLGTNFHEGASSSGTSNHEQRPASEGKNIDFESRRSTVEAVMKALKGNQTNPIIICGLGGIGKTTLMGQVHDRAKKEGLFDEYTKATFKESVDVIQIQGELAEYLGLPLEGNAKDARASKLRQRLSQGSKKILVMLDNVSTTIQNLSWDIGIPDSCKLLVTSRQDDVLKDMDRREIFPIAGLLDEDARRLFKKTAGSYIESDHDFRDVAEKILKKCGGLPIAISTVGTALRGQSIAIWKDAQGELERANPENVDGVIKHVYGPIKFSYESLPSKEAKSFFLLCCIFEGSADIEIEDLVRYALGLRPFEGTDSMVKGRNRVEALIQILKSRFLLLDTDDPECVRMHDVVRDVAVYIASEKFAKDGVLVRDTTATVKLMDWPKDSVSKESTYCSSLDDRITGICQLLLLRDTESLRITESLVPPPTIFDRIKDLKVLAIIRSSWRQVSLKSLVPSLAVLRNLHTLRLEDCKFDCDMSVIGKLRTLMILSLRGSNIRQLPETFKDLSDLRLLDLTDCEFLREIAPGVIKGLFRLEELYMWNSFKDWDWVVEKLASTETTNWISQLEEAEQESDSKEETKVEKWKRLNTLAVEQPTMVGTKFWRENGWFGVNAEQCTSWANSMDWGTGTGLLGELLSLTRLTTLQVILQPVQPVNKLLTTGSLTTSIFSKLERFRISIGWQERKQYWELEEQSGNYLRVFDLDVSVAMGSCITLLLEKASHVELKLTQPQLVNVLERVCFAKKKCLKFWKCNDVEHLFNPTTHPRSSSVIFPVLHTLEITGASRLKEIFHCELPTGFLKELRTLILSELPELSYIWKKTNNPSESEWGVLRNMIQHVQVLRVTSCSSLIGIIVKDRVVYDDEEVINFQCLTLLTLGNLKSFTGIISEGPEILPEDISSEQPDDISSEQSDVPMQPLFDTKVHFPVLRILQVRNFKGKEIWSNQPTTESFCELETLEVVGLHNLLHLVPTHMQNRLQKLERIEVSYCSSLEEIFESRRLIVSDEGDATASTISESGDQGTQMKKMVFFKQSRQAFQNLREMSITRCDSLRYLLSPSVARGLVKLHDLRVTYCEKIEEIVAAEGEETEDANMFPQLHYLELRNLPNLESFSQGKYNLKWPVATQIRIHDCRKMKKFCSGSLITSKELVYISVEYAGESVSQQLKDSKLKI